MPDTVLPFGPSCDLIEAVDLAPLLRFPTPQALAHWLKARGVQPLNLGPRRFYNLIMVELVVFASTMPDAPQPPDFAPWFKAHFTSIRRALRDSARPSRVKTDPLDSADSAPAPDSVPDAPAEFIEPNKSISPDLTAARRAHYTMLHSRCMRLASLLSRGFGQGGEADMYDAIDPSADQPASDSPEQSESTATDPAEDPSNAGSTGPTDESAEDPEILAGHRPPTRTPPPGLVSSAPVHLPRPADPHGRDSGRPRVTHADSGLSREPALTDDEALEADPTAPRDRRNRRKIRADYAYRFDPKRVHAASVAQAIP